MEKKRTVHWWHLYALIPLMFVLLFLDWRLGLPDPIEKAGAYAIILVVFGSMALWVHANQSALMDDEIANEHWVLRFDSEEEPGNDPNNLPLTGEPDDLYETLMSGPATHHGEKDA